MMPRGKDGRFLSKRCPECYGTLRPEVDNYFKRTLWICDGLIDPDNLDIPLQPCLYFINN